MQMLNVKEVARLLGVSRATVWRLSAAGQFPAPIKIGPNTTRWSLADVERFLADRRAVA